MKSHDIVVLLKLVSLEKRGEPSLFGEMSKPFPQIDPFSVRAMEASLGISKSEISASQSRSSSSGLATVIDGRISPNRRSLCEFIVYGVKYTFPARLGAPQRGVPTAFSAPMLQERLISAGQDIAVWPWKNGEHRGLAVEPLFRSVPDAAQRDERLYAYLALVDAIRLGNRREADLAKQMLSEDILGR